MAQITTFGDADPHALAQLERCVEAEPGAVGVLCADNHVGYSQPIGGAVGYENHVSVTGAGWDIGCLAAGTRVSTLDGTAVPIEVVAPHDRAMCWDGRRVRGSEPHFGSVDQGVREVVRLELINGRELVLTPDHQVRTPRGWIEARQLAPGDRVACVPFIGLRPEPVREIVDIPRPARVEALREMGLWPVPTSAAVLGALVRTLAYNCGDGNLSPNGKALSFWTVVPEDAGSLERDLRVLGVTPRRSVRSRRAGYPSEICIKVGSVALHSLFAALGAPVGRKAWPFRPMGWLFTQPDWVRAQFLSAFMSAQATTPALVENRVMNTAIKQAGENANAAWFVHRLFQSLGFEASVPRPSGSPRGARQTYLVQVLRGEAAQLRLFEDVGFCHAIDKRIGAARCASVAWRHQDELERRELMRADAKLTRASGAHWHGIEGIAERHDVSRGTAYHAWFSERGPSRRARHSAFAPSSGGEVAWVQVRSVEPWGRAPVYDVVTGDEAQSFVAEGVVVHNCGNKAVRTSLLAADVDVKRVMDEIARRISFGVGRENDEPVDHPVLDKIAKAPFAPQRKLLQTARSQLGTVGGGNHYVDLFEEEGGGRLWVGVHFGSRGFGHKTAGGFLSLAAGGRFDEHGREGGMDDPPVLLDVRGELGAAYVEAMSLAQDYAYAGRDVVVGKVLEILGTEADYEVHNRHNFVQREEHEGRMLWVVRKGCTPAFPGQEGFVGGSMGGLSVILAGRDSERSKAGLYSTVHGAGRVMSRRQAAGKVRYSRRKQCSVCRAPVEGKVCPQHPRAPVRRVRVAEQVSKGEIDWPSVRADLARQGIELRGGAADEAPGVYKRLEDVLAAHGDTIEIRHRLRPVGVAMAGANVVDPYRD